MLDRSSAFAPEGGANGGLGQGIVARPTLLDRAVKKARALGPLFLIAVILPTVCAILYFGLFASDVYLSESKFVVRAPDKSAASGLGVLLKTAGFSNAGDEVYAARDYVLSRDAARDLNKGNALRQAYGDSRVSVFDRFNPLGWDGSFEALYKFYQKKVSVEHDTASSITTLTVRAYSPQAAHQFNAELLSRAETLVNRLNERGRRDLISQAQAEVGNAKEVAARAAIALSKFRNQEGIVDPEKQATAQLQMISKLQDELIATRTQLMQLRTYTPKNPQIPVLESGAQSLSEQMSEEVAKIAGGARSLSSRAVQYQRLQLESQFADKQLAASMSSLEEARNEARRKQAYVERIVQPSLPDDALEPRRFRGVVTTLIMGCVVWGILRLLVAGIKEHVG